MRTRSLETLRREATTACKWRGHSMRWDKPFEYHGGQAQTGKCRVCGMEVTVMTRPMPNEIDIGGEAVALTCEPKEPPTLYSTEVLTEIDSEGEERIFSEGGEPHECFTDDVGRLFRSCQREYGRCTSRVYVDRADGSTPAVGWHFEKMREYEDSGRYGRPRSYYKQGAWVSLYTRDENGKYHSFELR